MYVRSIGTVIIYVKNEERKYKTQIKKKCIEEKDDEPFIFIISKLMTRPNATLSMILTVLKMEVTSLFIITSNVYYQQLLCDTLLRF